jgi:hypothetical protein
MRPSEQTFVWVRLRAECTCVPFCVWDLLGWTQKNDASE